MFDLSLAAIAGSVVRQRLTVAQKLSWNSCEKAGKLATFVRASRRATRGQDGETGSTRMIGTGVV
jgi:hypothetical protein